MSKLNCAPACCVMALKFSKGFTDSVEGVRNEIKPLGIWRDANIQHYLNINSVKHYRWQVTSKEEFLTTISDPDSIVIVNVDMHDLPRGAIINKPYRTFLPWWKHYLVIDGYDGRLIDVYDPYYNKLRKYQVNQMYAAIMKNNPNITVIKKDIYA